MGLAWFKLSQLHIILHAKQFEYSLVALTDRVFANPLQLIFTTYIRSSETWSTDD